MYTASDGGEPVAGTVQRRVLALLSLLTVAGEGGLSRDKIVGLLWSETDADRARHSLTQTLYAARRALGVDDLFVAAGDVRLNRERLTSDVEEFGAAIAAGELERAAELYQGPFLDGFFVTGAPEFEAWATAQRSRLESQAADALERLAVRAQEEGDHRREVDWRRRLAAIQPLDAATAVKLMTALANAGDRAGALQHARVHETLLREQLDLGPDPVVAAFAERLREPVAWTPAASELPEPPDGAEPADAPAVDEVTDERPAASLAVARGALAAHGPVEVLVPAPRVLAWRRQLIAATLALATLLTVWMVAEWRGDRPESVAPLAVRQKVVVAPFRVTGASASLAYLRDGMVELLSTRLADDSVARSVDAGAVLGAWQSAGLRANADVPRDTIVRLAARLGAERVVIGSVVGDGRRAVIGASVVTVPGGVVSGEATVEGPADSLTALVDRLAARLLTSVAGEDERLADQTSASLRALRAYLDGQAAFRRDNYGAALRHYDRALAIDSTFSLAALRLALAAVQLHDAGQVVRGVALAWPFRDVLSERDASQLVALAGPRYPAPSPPGELIAAWERLAELAPNRAEAWYQLGARYFHLGRAAGVTDAPARAVTAAHRALAADAAFAPAHQLLGALATTPSDSALGASAGAFATLGRWRAAALGGDVAVLRRIRDSLPLLGPATLRAIALASLHDAIALDDGASAVRALRSRAARPAERVDAALAEHAFAVNRGRPRQARDAATQLRELQTDAHAHLRLRVLDALYAEGDTATAAAAAAELSQATPARSGQAVAARDLADACVVAQWRVARGDSAGVAGTISRLRAGAPFAALPARTAPATCAVLLDAALAVSLGRRDAVDRVRDADGVVLAGAAADDASAYAPLLLARLHERLGDVPGALAAVRRRAHMITWPRYLATAWREEGRLAERAGEIDGARSAYARYLALRGAPEPPVVPAVTEVRRAAERLDAPSGH